MHMPCDSHIRELYKLESVFIDHIIFFIEMLINKRLLNQMHIKGAYTLMFNVLNKKKTNIFKNIYQYKINIIK